MQIHEDRYKLLDLKPSLHWYSSHFHTFDVWNAYDACLTMDGGFGGNMGNFTCKLCHASFYFLLSFSVFLPVAIAVDRSYAVTRPFDRTSISRHIKNVILTLWIFSLILSALVFANGRLKTNKKSYLCHTRSPLEYSNGKELNVISITLAVVIPMTLLAFSYTRICIKLWSRQAPGEGASQNQRQHSLLR